MRYLGLLGSTGPLVHFRRIHWEAQCGARIRLADAELLLDGDGVPPGVAYRQPGEILAIVPVVPPGSSRAGIHVETDGNQLVDTINHDHFLGAVIVRRAALSCSNQRCSEPSRCTIIPVIGLRSRRRR